MKAGLKYCGGCKPAYDRAAAVKDIGEQLGDGFEFTRADDEEADLIVVVTGCKTACADISALPDKPLHYITSPEDAGRFLAEMKKLMNEER